MGILKTLKRLSAIGDKVAFGLVIAVLVGLFVVFPLSLPALVASNIKSTKPGLIIFSAFIYLVIWFAVLFMLVDSAAYIYDFKRPFIAARPSRRWFSLGESTVRTKSGFIGTSLLSYALTLHAFAVAYTLVSNRDKYAFNVQRPLSFPQAVYFSVSTAATVGYGDISPLSPTARCIATVEIVMSFLYLVLIFSTISGLARARITWSKK